MRWIKDYWLLIFLLLVVLISAVLAWQLVELVTARLGSFFPNTNSRGDWGVLGDLFGGLLNPFFALLGLVMLLVTLFQNQRELSLSRKEFEDSAAALKEQAETLEKQRFEDTFFSLLEQHNSALNNITAERVTFSDGKQGNAKSISEAIRTSICGGGIYSLPIDTFTGLHESRETLHKGDDTLNQYFRILYQVLKFIASNCPGSSIHGNYSVESLEKTTCSNEEKLYSNIVRSLLSDNIYHLLAVNCSCKERKNTFYKYKLLIERYSFLEHMSLDKDDRKNMNLLYEIVGHYDKKAFGENSDYSAIVTQ